VPGSSLIEKAVELHSINAGLDVVFDHLDKVPPRAVLEVADQRGERVISVCAATARGIREVLASRPRALNEHNVLPI
jgi:hypothetical protein